MASSKLCLLAALIILATLIGSAQSASCCLRYSKRPVPCIRVRGYNIQTINTSCDIPAIIFHLPGRFVCADPLAGWTKRAMECVFQRRKKITQIIKEGTRYTTASTTTSTTASTTASSTTTTA